MTPFAERILEELRKLEGEPVRAGILVARLNCAGVKCARRTVYNYLRELEAKQMVVRPSERRWCAA